MIQEALILAAGVETGDNETILRTLGDRFQIVSATTNDVGFLHDTEFDLVIVDLESHGADGLEFLRAWQGRDLGTPLIALTEGRDVGIVVEAMKLGVTDCLLKPIDPDELRNLVAPLFKGRKNIGASNRSGDRFSRSAKQDIAIPPGTSLENLERVAVEQALVEHRGNRTHAAKTLGISVRTLQRKLKAWGIPISPFQTSAPASSFVLHPPGPTHHAFSSHVH